MKNEKWFELDVSQIEKKLKTNAASGISGKAARSRWNRNDGTLFSPNKRSGLRMLGELVADFSLILLLLTSVIALFFDDFYRVFSILMVVSVNLSVSFVIYYRSQRILESMESFFRPTAKVIRAGKLYNIDYNHVVRGDVVLLERGDIVCADIRLVSSDSLAVSMRTSKDEYVYLEKDAYGIVRQNEIDAKKHLNMLYAGSVIEQGSARGIVTAVGKYTYLGAMTGGISETNRDIIPYELRKLKRFCSSFSMISLIAVLPFCILSFFISQAQGAEVTLSTAFLTALALSASTLSQIAMTLCKVFYINNVKKLVFANTPAAIRSADALEKLARADYLLVLDGSPFSNGELEFERAVTFDGEIASYDAISFSTSMLSSAVGIYSIAEKRSLSAKISESAEFEKGIERFCTVTRTDKEALAIRYPQIFHHSENNGVLADSAIYYEGGNEYHVSVSYTDDVLERCQTVTFNSSMRLLNQEGILRLKKMFQRYVELGKRVVVFTVLNVRENTRSFVGMLVFNSGIDQNAPKKIASLYNQGLKTIVCSSKTQSQLPEVPDYGTGFLPMSCKKIKDSGLPITYNFGKYRHYCDCTDKDITDFVEYIKSNKKKVAILGFSDFAAEAIEHSDLFISCAPVRPMISGHLYEEITALGTDGGAKDASCIQMVKNEAEILIPRPRNESGGLASLVTACRAGNITLKNLKQFVRYLICTQIIRLCTVAIPMLFGSIALDGRHVLFCSFILDFAAFFMFVTSKDNYSIKNSTDEGYNRIVREKSLLIPAVISSLTLIFLPRIFGFFDIGGRYLCEEGCAFSALIYLHLTVFYVLRYGKSKKLSDLIHEIPLLIYFAAVVIFMIFAFSIEPIRPIFSLEMGNPFPYFLLSFVPAIVFACVYFLLNDKENKC